MKVSAFFGYGILGLVGMLMYQSNQSNQVNNAFPKASNKVSDNPIIQSAYQDCVFQTRQQIVDDNPDSPGEIMNYLLDTALQTCHSAVVITCHRNFEGYSCQSIIEIYQPPSS